MKTEYIVLGWAKAGAVYPPQIAQAQIGTIDMLMIAQEDGQTPRDRLRWQLKCFEAAQALVPTCPQHICLEHPTAQVTQIQLPSLTNDLEKLDGQGQFSLALKWVLPARAKPSTDCGRGWLVARRADHAHAKAFRDRAMVALNALISTNLDTVKRERNGVIQCDVLVPRMSQNQVLQEMKQKAESMDAADLHLAGSGLWPPSSFVTTFAPRAEAPA